MVWSNSQTQGSTPAGIVHFILLLVILSQRAGASASDGNQDVAINAIPQLKYLQLEELPAQHELKHSMPMGLNDSDSLVRSMREQIALAKKMFGFARLNKYPRLLRELRYRIKETEEAIGTSVVNADLPKSAPEKLKALKRVTIQAMERHTKCDDSVRRLRGSVLANEDIVLGLTEEVKYLGRLAARTIPKGVHCLTLQLTIHYYNQFREKGASADNIFTLKDNSLCHYVMYTENILAATAVINSTISSAKEPHRHVFHLLTNGLNHAALHTWFQSNQFDTAVIEVRNIDNSNFMQISRGLDEQARRYLKPAMAQAQINLQKNFEIMKRVGLYYDLPEIFPMLDKVMVVDDDIVVRKDMTPLWEEDLHGNVIGALASCEMQSSLDDFHGGSCINMVDLRQWRRQGLSEMHTYSILNQPEGRIMLDDLMIPLQNNTLMLDDRVYHVLDLDDIGAGDVTRKTVAIHFRGYAKPWLGMAMNSRHRFYWTRFVNYDNPLLQACNINK